MRNIEPADFKITGKRKLANIPTFIPVEDKKKEKIRLLKDARKKLAKRQDIMYAHGRYAVLICIQGMDTSGKDSLIRDVFKAFNPRGVTVHSFKVPSAKELKHDYIWRHYRALPEKGKFAVFNRTHYENVLVTRVNKHLILKENLPGIEKLEDIRDDMWDQRFEQINHFEKHITENGVIVLKFFLHLSKEEQRNRLIRRLVTEKHNWKFTPSDLTERSMWDDYQRAYEEAITRTSTSYAPWYVIPADDKHTARYLVAKAIYEEMSKYTDISEPELAAAIKQNIESYIEQLQTDK